MNVDWQAVGSIGSIVSALAAIGALFFVIINIWLLSRTLRANINGTLLQQSIELLRYIADKLHLYDYFYYAKLLNPDDTYKIEVLCACEMLANYSASDGRGLTAPRPPQPVPPRDQWIAVAQLNLS